MELILTRTRSFYRVDVDSNDMELLRNNEDKKDHEIDHTEHLISKLEALNGVEDVDIDDEDADVTGIHFCIETEYDTPETHQAIIKMIDDHLAQAESAEDESADEEA